MNERQAKQLMWLVMAATASLCALPGSLCLALRLIGGTLGIGIVMGVLLSVRSCPLMIAAIGIIGGSYLAAVTVAASPWTLMAATILTLTLSTAFRECA